MLSCVLEVIEAGLYIREQHIGRSIGYIHSVKASGEYKWSTMSLFCTIVVGVHNSGVLRDIAHSMQVLLEPSKNPLAEATMRPLEKFTIPP